MYLDEIFAKVDALNEEVFDADSEGIKDLKDFEERDAKSDEVEIIDDEAETEKDLKKSYVGKVILDCCVCHSKIYRDRDKITVNEDMTVADEGVECPYCYQTDGYKIVGVVADFKPEEEKEVKTETEVEVKEEKLTEDKKPIKENARDDKVMDVIGKHFNYGGDFDFYDVIKDVIDRIGNLNDEDEVQSAIDDALIYNDDIMKVYMHYHDVHELPVETMDAFANDIYAIVDDLKGEELEEKCENKKEEALGNDVARYQKWVDYDMKRYGKVSEETERLLNKAGFSLVKDQYGEYEVIAKEPIHEGLEKVEVKTEDGDKITVKTEEEKVVVEAEKETVKPLTDEDKQEIAIDVAKENEEDVVDIDIDDFDEETFDKLTESYLKRVYNNIKSYKTEACKSKGNTITLEGKITFKSGNEKPTQFMFESVDVSGKGKIRMLGQNCQITPNKKAFTMVGDMKEKKFIAESLNYNYRVPAKKGTQRMYGTVKAGKRG